MQTQGTKHAEPQSCDGMVVGGAASEVQWGYGGPRARKERESIPETSQRPRHMDWLVAGVLPSPAPAPPEPRVSCEFQVSHSGMAKE